MMHLKQYLGGNDYFEYINYKAGSLKINDFHVQEPREREKE